ncbi:MAG: MFS transporter [Chloroflexi bacterium]|nr:MFS transporter [Chloroflexota bacterium]MDA1240072.1 MFS transporter [Chloroflexota bacterium]
MNGSRLRVGRPFYGWWVVGVGALVAFSSGPGQSFIFGVFLDSLIEDTGLSRTAISGLYAIGTGVSAFMVFTVSRLADRWGARITLIGAATALGFACFAMSWAQGAFMVFLAFSALRALGQGSMTINATLLTAQWFVAKRGRAVAAMGLGFPLSAAILPPMTRYLIDTIGWREAYGVLGVMVWVLVLPGALFIVRDRPEQMGLHPDGADSPPAAEVAAASAAAEATANGATIAPPRVLSSPRFWLLALPLATPSLVVTGLIFHQTGIVEENGLSAQTAAALFLPYAVLSASISVVAGFAIDRLGPKVMFAISMSLLLCAMGVAQVMNSLGVAILYAMLIGATNGTTRIVAGVTWAHYYGREGLGRVQGSASMIGIAASAFGPLPFAFLQGLFDGFRPGIALMALMPAMAIFAVLLAKPPGEDSPTGAAALARR